MDWCGCCPGAWLQAVAFQRCPPCQPTHPPHSYTPTQNSSQPQVMGILGAMVFVRMGLEPLVKALRQVFRASGPWEKSSEFHILREVRRECHS